MSVTLSLSFMLHFHSENELKSTNLLVNVVSLDCSITGVSVLSENGKVLYHFVDSGKQPADDHDGTEVKKVLLHQRRLFGDIIVNSEATFVHCIGVGPFHNITIQESVYLVASSHHHTLFCTSTRVLSWGIGNHGELGLGRDRLRADEPSVISTLAAKSVAVGEYHSCYALQDGSFYTFGCGAFHRLGLGDDESRYTPTLVEDLLTVGDLRADGTMSGVESVSCGFWHTFVVSSGVRDVYSWGWNKFGQVSDSASELGKVIPTPQRISGLDSLLSDEDDVVQAACGHRFTLLRTVSGNLLILCVERQSFAFMN